MSNYECTLTTRHLLYYTFIFASFLHVFSSGFTWIQFPKAKKEAEIGTIVTLRWRFKLSKNENHYSSRLTNTAHGLAERQETSASFTVLHPGTKYKLGVNFTMNNGTHDVWFTFPNVQRSFDGPFCFHETYKIGGTTEPEKSTCVDLFTFAKPLIVFSPNPKLLMNVTDQKHLFCNATGKPDPVIIWKKTNPSTVPPTASNWFHLSVTSPSVQGFYMCIANNSYGTHNKTFFVEVQYKPEIQYIPKDQIRQEGTTVLLYCNASGNPTPNVIWSKNDQVKDKLGDGQGSASLKLSNINSTYTGEYLCSAKNLLGKTSNTTSLTVRYRPINTILTASLKPEDVIAGRELILNCTSSALPKANQFEFFHNNASVTKNVTGGVHKISKITASDSGEYKCVPSNVLGKGAPANVKIDVLVPPKLNESLENRNITINETNRLELRCSASGNPIPVITWTKYPNIKLLESDIYKKENTSRDDAGVYRCTANNSIGEAAHSEANVIVNYASEITNITSNPTVNETKSVSLHCNAQGLPKPRVQWFKGSLAFGKASTSSASVNLQNVTWKDGGKYVCRASNLLATKFAATELNVQYKPINTTLTTDTGKYELAIHETLVLSCNAQANPPANWFKFENSTSTLQESSNSTYTIRKNAWSPAEEYKCLPRNMLGDGTPASVNISFLEQPSFRKVIPGNKSLTVNETEKMELHCLVRGTPKPNVTWTKDGASETISNKAVFTKNNVNRSDAGIYRCIASNGVGRVLEAEFSVVVNYKPINTRLVSISGRYGITINESLTLNCSTESIPRPNSYSFQVNGSTINRTSSSNSTLTISKAQSFYDENYTCIATNQVGSGQKSNVITLTMYERPFISSKRKNVTVDENKRFTLECTASGKPRPQITWTKGNSTDIIARNKTYIKARAEKCDAGVYRCTADNGVMEPVTAQATVTVKSLPEAPEILNIAISIPRIEVHWKQPPINCSLPITGYLAQVREKGSQETWTECEASHNTKTDEWSCSVEELEGGTTYTLQLFAINRFGRGQPAVKDFETKELGGASSSDARKGGLSRNEYIIIGACVGGLILLVVIIIVIKKCKTRHGESNLQTPIELKEQEEGQIITSPKNEVQNGCNGPMTASQETLEVKETGEEKENTLMEEKNGEKESDEDKKM